MPSQPANGRYFTNPTYILPTDDEESKRLAAQHRVLTQIFDGRLILAPVKWEEGDMVLEVGAAGGTWLTEVAQDITKCTNAKFHGIDITARLFPTQLPRHTTYSVASVAKLPEIWTGRFAYVHQRLLMGALKDSQWSTAVQEMFRVTKPGGWVELNEGVEQYRYPGNRARPKAFDIVEEVFLARSLKRGVAKELANLLEENGFVNVTTVHKTVPLGRWNGELGDISAQSNEAVFRSIKELVVLHNGFGIVTTGEEYDALIDDLVKEWNNVPGFYWDLYISYGQKPLGAHE